ncbi:hypothetical protein NX801_06280 [Streptomyces sp. LP05-1]|uniref:Uncharacterized protein n=1 Tax=Streptomyces pyxinae TaxID=2970734 RepID=A0ABT2CCY2_9ACTN|nr:hypothetical protein [Streptomyces sp. LP05-1]MCS0635268.1 hypothetical protein [Streptomyces sp. LP05-1]
MCASLLFAVAAAPPPGYADGEGGATEPAVSPSGPAPATPAPDEGGAAAPEAGQGLGAPGPAEEADPDAGLRPAVPAPEPSPTGSPSAHGPARPVPSPSLAGRPAGEGRERPGRSPEPSLSASAEDVEQDAADPVRTRTATEHQRRRHGHDWERAAPRQEARTAADPQGTPPEGAYEPAAARAAESAVERQIPVLTLGVGFSMMGLGLGFLGLRMRRR